MYATNLARGMGVLLVASDQQLQKRPPPTSPPNALELRRNLSALARRMSSVRHTTMRKAMVAKIVPLSSEGASGPATSVVVENIDERGITFAHPSPLSNRRAAIVFEGHEGSVLTAELDLSWCRFTRHGKYSSGGRFVQPVRQTA